MQRKIINKLLDWKNSRLRMPLVLTGARQIGKTYSVMRFGKMHYDNVVYFNFEFDAELKRIFEQDLVPVRIIKELTARSGQTILSEKTLIFFDKIQACPQALTSLKYFCEQAPEYHIIAAGSLLGVAVRRESQSFPVGKVNQLTMYPLDFEEFLWAMDLKPAADLIRECFEANSEFSSHNKFLELYMTYLLTGGMPQVLDDYIKNKDFNFVKSLQAGVLNAYIADMSKYATPFETSRIIAAYKSIPAQLAKPNRKFQYRIIKKGARAYEYADALDWLQNAGVIYKCEKVSAGKFSLKQYAEPDFFKVYLSDAGLLAASVNLPEAVITSNFPAYDDAKGAITENYVLNALIANGYSPYYWESNGQAEVDFIIQKDDGSILPIEVKSSENVKAKSLKEYVAKYNPPYSMRVSRKNFGFENNIKSVPLYAVFCI
jgi:predicted AAA+ superfamily ATPase